MYLRSGVVKMSARRCNGIATERAQAGSGQAFFSDRTQCVGLLPHPGRMNGTGYLSRAQVVNTCPTTGTPLIGVAPVTQSSPLLQSVSSSCDD